MTGRKRLTVGVAIAVVLVLIGGTVLLVREAFWKPTTITADFETTTAIYPGDDVRVSGVKVGTIESIQPMGDRARIVMSVDRDVPIPVNAKAIIVAQNLVAARYVQLTPAYREGDGETMQDGAVIDIANTGIPVEWDQVKEQLTVLAEELGPKGDNLNDTSVSRFIDEAAGAMDDNGARLRETLAQLSGVSRVLAQGSGDIVDIIKNLQVFISTLKDSNTQIIQFQDRLASLTSVLDDNKSDLDAALSNLSVAIGEVQRFVAGSRNQTAEQIQRLGNVTQVLADNRIDLENILHVAPNAFANGYNIYNPDTGSALGNFTLNNFSNPTQAICGMIGAVENATAGETAKLCADYLGPALRLFNFNYLPIPLNPFLMPSARPESIVYSEPDLMPGQPVPSDPNAAPTNVQDLLLPAEVPPGVPAP